ncbi:hypothetical protein PsorP6_003128 [Peronosclerospora sorghi]|uniref:Uncharacterized protein n=1 Tax=Peronosclerospora sorghi TaxID=230839 RepID=A0ACC0VKQ7_9STRA|nr:hypothetical protein PsorP6_003128 [Peronosclerospora sorghi]
MSTPEQRGRGASEDKTADNVYVTKNRSLFSMWLHGKAGPSRAHAASTTTTGVVFRAADVIQEGYLLKQGLRLKLWTRRYFILRLEERHMTLGYYTSKESLTLCAETPIGAGHVLGPVNRTKYPRRLELRWGTKVLTLEAEDDHAYERWKTALQEAIRWHHAMVPTKDGSFSTYGQQAADALKQEEQSRLDAAKRVREKQQAADDAVAAVAAHKPKYLPAPRPGTQCFLTSNTKFEIPCTFEYVKTIGSGAYGVVIAATDLTTGKPVAIKNIQRAFDDLTDAKRIVREIKLMRHLQHKCVLGVDDIFTPVSLAKFEDVYIVSQLMATDLHRVIYSRHALSDDHIAFFLYQMLCAIKYVHSANVIHRDLKPSNILVNANCELKICDFGLARGLLPEQELELTEYVEFQKRGPKPTKSLVQLFPDAPPLALDLLQRMLVIDPNKRIRVDDALAHPYLASIRNVEDETTATSCFEFDFENEKLTKPVLQRLIWDEMRHFHPDVGTGGDAWTMNQDDAPPPTSDQELDTAQTQQEAGEPAREVAQA